MMFSAVNMHIITIIIIMKTKKVQLTKAVVLSDDVVAGGTRTAVRVTRAVGADCVYAARVHVITWLHWSGQTVRGQRSEVSCVYLNGCNTFSGAIGLPNSNFTFKEKRGVSRNTVGVYHSSNCLNARFLSFIHNIILCFTFLMLEKHKCKIVVVQF